MPTDPRKAIGACGPSTGPIFEKFEPWMTGGAGAGDIGAGQTAQYPYPPTTLENAGGPVVQLPLYTSTGTIATLPVPTYTNSAGKPVASGNGWYNANDNQLAPTAIPGCAYPNGWDANNATIPTGCTSGDVLPATITPPPTR